MILNNSTRCKLIYFAFNYKRYHSTTITSMILIPDVYLKNNKNTCNTQKSPFQSGYQIYSWDTGHIEDHSNDTCHKSKALMYSVLFTKLDLDVAIMFQSLITKWKISEKYGTSWNLIGYEQFLLLCSSLRWDHQFDQSLRIITYIHNL